MSQATELPVVASRPSEVIDLRRELVEFWKRDGKLQRALAMQGRRRLADTPASLTPQRQGAQARAWFADTLQRASMYWVSPEMVDALAALAPTVPDVVAQPPLPEALVVFAKPLPGLDADTGITIHTAAYLWGPVILVGTHCLSIDTFGWRDFMHPMNLSEEEEKRWRLQIPTKLVNTGGAEWPVGSEISDMIFTAPESPQMRDSILEDRRVMTAFWALCQGRMAAESFDHGDRAARRRSNRAGIMTGAVRVITLRQPERRKKGTGEESRKVDWTHRWPVGLPYGFIKEQPYGPGGKLRKAIHIDPYVKGPEDKPFVIKETVRALRR